MDSLRASFSVLVRDGSFVGCFRRFSAEDAVTKARELKRDGASHVAIRDGEGNMFGPAEFDQVSATPEA